MTNVYAGSLLGVLGTNGDSGLVTLNSGAAQSNGLVNVGLGSSGSSPNNVASVGVGGGSSPLATANVSSGGGSGLLSVDANVGGGLANVGLGIGGGGGSGNPGNPGGPGSGGNGGNGGMGGNGGPGVIIIGNGGGGGASAGFFSGGPGCNDANSGQVLRLVAGSKYNNRMVNGWSRASNVQVVPLRVCSAAKANLAAAAAANRTFGLMQQAVVVDPLISTSLTRAKSHVGRVLGVSQSGPTVTVYVY